MKKITSEQFEFIYEDIKKAIFNSLKFGSPLLLIILLALQKGVSFDDIELLAYGWLLQFAIDLVTKFISVNTYSVKK